MSFRSPSPLSWPENPLSRLACEHADEALRAQYQERPRPREWHPGAAAGWTVAAQIWDMMWEQPVVGERGKALPAACFTLLARGNLRAGVDEYEPQHLWWMADLETGFQFCEHLMLGETEQLMVDWFGNDRGMFHLLGARQKAEMLLPMLRWLPQPAQRWSPPQQDH